MSVIPAAICAREVSPSLVKMFAACLATVAGGRVDHIEVDVRDPGTILQDAAETLDFSQPTAVMMLGILGEIPDSDSPGAIVATQLESLPARSYLAISDGTDTSPALNQAIATYNQNVASPTICVARSKSPPSSTA